MSFLYFSLLPGWELEMILYTNNLNSFQVLSNPIEILKQVWNGYLLLIGFSLRNAYPV